jgi:hypothetical protein
MITKRIRPEGWFGDRPLTTLLDVHARGIERGQLQKIAAADFIFTVDVRPVRGFSHLHIITTGAGESYGQNNNADFYNKEAREFRCANGKVLQLDGGLTKYHNTFMKYGSVYRQHHNSKKGGKSWGDIVAETFNPVMQRGELIVKVADDRWHDDLEKLAKGDLLWWSIGCSVPYDHCSLCGNRAPTRRDYCDHMRYNANGLDKEGNAVFVINDQPCFHDISEVGNNPADRIAGTLRKVASERRGEPFVDEDTSRLWVPLSVVNRLGSRTERDRLTLLDKLAAIEKRIKAEGMLPEEELLAQGFGEDNPEQVAGKLGVIPLEQMLSALKSSKIMLPPRTFVRIVMKRPAVEIAGTEGLPAAIKDIFSYLKEQGNTEEIMDDGSYALSRFEPARSVASSVDQFSDCLSLDPEAVRKRIVIITVGGGPGGKQKNAVGAPLVTPEARILAKEYAKYQLSFLAACSDEQLLHTVAIHNQAF